MFILCVYILQMCNNIFTLKIKSRNSLQLVVHWHHYLFQEYMRAMRVANPRIRELQLEMENDDVVRYDLSPVIW